MRSITISLITLFCISSIGVLPTFATLEEDRLEEKITNETLANAMTVESQASTDANIKKALGDAASTVSGNGPTYVYTTEKVPGADCICYIGGGPVDEKECDSVTRRQYKCSVGSGLQGFEKIFRSITGYLVKISILLGVLAIVMFGIGWALLGGDEENTKKLKKYAVNLLVGLTILFLFSYILGFLAPWIFHS